MGTENSSVETRKRAKDLASAIGACVQISCLRCKLAYRADFPDSQVPYRVSRLLSSVRARADLRHPQPEYGRDSHLHSRFIRFRDRQQAPLQGPWWLSSGESCSSEYSSPSANVIGIPLRSASAVGKREGRSSARSWECECRRKVPIFPAQSE